MPWMKLGCGECGEFEADGYDCKWRRHLQSDSHQQVARVRTFSYDAEQKKRCLAVFGLSKVPMKEVLTHFFDSNAVSDFVFWNERPDFCLVEFFSRTLRNVVAGGKHFICGVCVLVELLEEIPDLEWQSICSSASSTNSVTDKKETGSTEASVVFDSPASSANSNNNSSSSDEEENVENTGVSDKIDDVTKSISSDTDEEEFVCEKKKNANAPLIEIKDDDGGLGSAAVGSDLELQMKKLVKAQQMSSKDFDFRVDTKDRLERHLQFSTKSRCRLIMFSLGSAFIDSRMNDVLHLYLDRWGVVDEMNNPLAAHQWQTHRSFLMDMFELELGNVMSTLEGALKLPPTDTSFIVTRVELKIRGVIDFRYTNDKDELRCTIHLNDFDYVQSSRLLKLYCQLDDRVEPFCHVLLEWASKRTFIGQAIRLINPEVILWLAVFFLVHQRFIPPPSFLHEHHRLSKEGTEFWYSGKLTSFTKDVQTVKHLMQNDRFRPVNSDGKTRARETLRLAGAFFLFYSNFDFSRYSIDLFNGLVILKTDAWPMSIKSHPFSFNTLTRFVPFSSVYQFSDACAKTFQDLIELLSQDSTEVNDFLRDAVNGGKKTPVDLLKVLHDDTALTPMVRRQVYAAFTQAWSGEDVLVVCEAVERRNILDTIDLRDKEINHEDEVPEDLETQMEKVYEANLMPKEEWNFAKSVTKKVENYLRDTLQSPCKLVRFGVGGYRIRLTNYNDLYLYFDSGGVVEKHSKSGKEKLLVMDYASLSALDHQIMQIKSALEELTSSAGFKIEDITILKSQLSFKYTDVTGSVVCKIFLEDFDTVQVHRLLNVYSSLDFRVRPLLLVARQWSRARVWESTLDPEHLQWMVIFFLMRQTILPPVHSLRDTILRDFQFKNQKLGFSTRVEDIISNCGDAYDLQKKGSFNAVTILKLAKKMFEFYCLFDFRKFLINLCVGQVKEKSVKLGTNESALTISHPFEFKCNVTSLVEENNLDLFTDACTEAAAAISNLLQEATLELKPTKTLLNILRGVDAPGPTKIKSDQEI